MSRTYKTDEEFIAYTNGLDRGLAERGDLSRIEAFAAIRRAAKVARELDAKYKEAYLVRDWDTCSQIHDGYGIRRAIRAAIGSEKA